MSKEWESLRVTRPRGSRGTRWRWTGRRPWRPGQRGLDRRPPRSWHPLPERAWGSIPASTFQPHEIACNDWDAKRRVLILRNKNWRGKGERVWRDSMLGYWKVKEGNWSFNFLIKNLASNLLVKAEIFISLNSIVSSQILEMNCLKIHRYILLISPSVYNTSRYYLKVQSIKSSPCTESFLYDNLCVNWTKLDLQLIGSSPGLNWPFS